MSRKEQTKKKSTHIFVKTNTFFSLHSESKTRQLKLEWPYRRQLLVMGFTFPGLIEKSKTNYLPFSQIHRRNMNMLFGKSTTFYQLQIKLIISID